MTGSYANLSEVRRLAGGIGSIPDAEMQDFVDFGNVMIESCTGVFDLSSSNQRYKMMEQGAEYYASAAVRDHYSDKLKTANTHWERAKLICEAIIKFNLTGSDESRAVSQGYMTYPANQETGLYFSDRYVERNSGTSVFYDDEIE